jgi:hypothetical protein
VEVPPGGNRVRSYLDIIMPDEVMWAEARRSFITFLSKAQGSDFPWEGVSGRCTFRVGLEQRLAANWQHEIAQLLRAAEAVHGLRDLSQKQFWDTGLEFVTMFGSSVNVIGIDWQK